MPTDSVQLVAPVTFSRVHAQPASCGSRGPQAREGTPEQRLPIPRPCVLADRRRARTRMPSRRTRRCRCSRRSSPSRSATRSERRIPRLVGVLFAHQSRTSPPSSPKCVTNAAFIHEGGAGRRPRRRNGRIGDAVGQRHRRRRMDRGASSSAGSSGWGRSPRASSNARASTSPAGVEFHKRVSEPGSNRARVRSSDQSTIADPSPRPSNPDEPVRTLRTAPRRRASRAARTRPRVRRRRRSVRRRARGRTTAAAHSYCSIDRTASVSPKWAISHAWMRATTSSRSSGVAGRDVNPGGRFIRPMPSSEPGSCERPSSSQPASSPRACAQASPLPRHRSAASSRHRRSPSAPPSGRRPSPWARPRPARSPRRRSSPRRSSAAPRGTRR